MTPKTGVMMLNISFDHINKLHLLLYTTQIPEMLGRFLNVNKMKTKRLSNHMSQYFIHYRT